LHRTGQTMELLAKLQFWAAGRVQILNLSFPLFIRHY
jgi:hypothetical protein